MADRPRDGRFAGCAALLSVVLAEFGHQLSFLERFGGRGFRLEAAGVHSYFPTLMTVAGALVGAGALGALLVLSLGRLAMGGALGRTRRPGIPMWRLLIVMLALQLAVYLVQESCEALAAGRLLTAPWLFGALAWGAAGQAPIAVLAALALSWLSVRLDRAIAAIRGVIASLRSLSPAPVDRFGAALVPSRAPYLSLASICGTALVKRGPPGELLAR